MAKKNEKKELLVSTDNNKYDILFEGINETLGEILKMLIELSNRTTSTEVSDITLLNEFKRGCDALIKYYTNKAEMNNGYNMNEYMKATQMLTEINKCEIKIREEIEHIILNEYGTKENMD